MLNKCLKNLLLERPQIIRLPGVPPRLSPACLPPIRTWLSQGLCIQSQSSAKVHMVKAMVLLVVMYRYKRWTIKKAEHWRIDAFEVWCWRRLLRAPWTAWRSNQSILNEINPDCSMEGLLLKLKLQYFGHLMQIADALEKTLMMGKIEGGRRRGRQRIRWSDSITNSMDMSLSKHWEMVKDRKAWQTAIHGIVKSQTQLSN